MWTILRRNLKNLDGRFYISRILFDIKIDNANIATILLRQVSTIGLFFIDMNFVSWKLPELLLITKPFSYGNQNNN
jgi:hypothetical protein